MGIIFRKRGLFVLLVVALAALGLVWFFVWRGGRSVAPTPSVTIEATSTSPKYELVGKSVEGRKIEAYTYGQGQTKLLFVGGIHGGYEWNSVVLAYDFLDYLDAAPSGTIPANLAVMVIPSANPDGVFKVTGKEGRFAAGDVSKSQTVLEAGRLNADKVDLNRNFDCKWQAKGTWKSRPVSGGTKAFSEPEAAALRDFILAEKPAMVLFWHSQANAVYASQCKGGILPETSAIMKAYSRAAGYPAVETFDAYTVTGAAEDWLASINIPAITVELKTHESVEWTKNLAGIKALFEYYGR